MPLMPSLTSEEGYDCVLSTPYLQKNNFGKIPA